MVIRKNDVINFISGFLVPDSRSYGLTKHLNITERIISGSIRAWIEFFKGVYKISEKYAIGKSIYKKMLSLIETKYGDLFGSIYEKFCDTTEKDNDGDLIGYISLLSRERLFELDEPDIVYFNTIPHTLRFTVDRGILSELTRHRLASFSAASTRYINYGNEKNGEEITVIKPYFFTEDGPSYEVWKHTCQTCEDAYLSMIKNGVRPEMARTVLPNSLATELVVTATEEEWQHIINLRYHGTTGRPHPQMLEVMEMAYPILVEESEGRIK